MELGLDDFETQVLRWDSQAKKKNKEFPSFQPLSSAGRVSGPMRFGLCKPMILMMEVASLLPPDGRSGCTFWGRKEVIQAD